MRKPSSNVRSVLCEVFPCDPSPADNVHTQVLHVDTICLSQIGQMLPVAGVNGNSEAFEDGIEAS